MEIIEYLKQAVETRASDVFIIAGGPVSMKVDGRIKAVSDEKLLPPKTKSLITEIYQLAELSMEKYLQTGDDDFAFAIPGLSRFRVNAYRQRGSMAAVVRVVSFSVMSHVISAGSIM